MRIDPAVDEATIVNNLGLHTRSATMLVKLANTFSSEIFVSVDGLAANAKSIMGLLALGARKGAIVRIEARGRDQNAAVTALKKLIDDGFQEAGG